MFAYCTYPNPFHARECPRTPKLMGDPTMYCVHKDVSWLLWSCLLPKPSKLGTKWEHYLHHTNALGVCEVPWVTTILMTTIETKVSLTNTHIYNSPHRQHFFRYLSTYYYKEKPQKNPKGIKHRAKSIYCN